MKKWFAAILMTLGFFPTAWCQSSPLMVQGENGKLYLEHAVEPGENWYSIGRLYNVSPREMAAFNRESMDKSLSIGQHLKIPLTVVNFSQDGSKGSGETLVPVYHILQEKEWLYRISTNYNAVPVENLEKWNHINRDHTKKGMQLIIGFLKVKTAQSALAKPGSPGDKPVDPSLDRTKPDEISSLNSNLAKPETKAANTSFVETEIKPVNSYAINHPMGGYFRPDFGSGNGSASGLAGTFKSSSGWKDGKYYALMNNIQVGTIVKVTNTATHKTIYAKILGQLPEMKESTGLIIRISNAGASELGIEEIKFPVEIKF
jgi:LysM repeat protein